MNRKYLLLVLFVLSSAVIAGCGEEEKESVGPFVGGANGLSISFVEGAPVTEFSQDKEVPVKLLVKNNGEYTVSGDLAEVQIYGLPLSEFGLSGEYKKVKGGLKGIKKGFLEEGGEQIVDMGVLKYSREVSGYVDKTLYGRICYPYKTKAVVTACITSRDVGLVEKNGVCEVTGDKLVSGGVSSGPVQITEFSEQLSGADSVSFRIVIENKGNGNVYDLDSVCSELNDPVVLSEKKGRVRVSVKPENVKCNFLEGESNVGYIRLGDLGSKSLVCTMKAEGSSSYEQDIEIDLDYKYIDTTSVNMRILEA
jgi:hypothetical protein